MKIPQRISICIMLCSFVLLVGLIACNEEAHDGECGLTVAFDNRQCPDIPIDNVKLYIYDTSRNLTAVYNYVDARGVAVALLSLEIGHYTVAVVINADEEVTLTVQYEGYFPSAFNVANGKPSNAITNLSFTNALPEVPDGSKEAQIASDWILTGGEDTFVNVNICIRDKNGAVRTNTTGVKIAHKRNHQTIIRGNFLTAGIGSGGVNINTEWEDTYVIEF